MDAVDPSPAAAAVRIGRAQSEPVALIEFSDVSLAPLDESRLWGFYLDFPKTGTSVEAAAVGIWGWVIGRSSPAVAIEILDERRVIRRVPIDTVREDVARVYPAAPKSSLSGFATILRMRAGIERDLEVQAVLKDHSRVPLATLRLRTQWRADESGDRPLVSIIIPCYQQAHYLAQAIESVLSQTYPHVEVLVIDDGSPDNTSEIAARYPGVRCVRQPNRGVSEARNLGIRSSNGSFLIFLDADDRLRPDAIEIGLGCFRRHPEVALVSGRFRYISADGSTLYENQGHIVEASHYAAMLHRNYIPAPCGAMCRRDIFEEIDGFNPALSVCADYDFYLRVLRRFPAWSHDEEVADYRRHGLGLSTRSGQMLREALMVLRSQGPYVKGDPALGRAYRGGIRFWKSIAADLLAREIRMAWQDGRSDDVLRNVLHLGRCGRFALAPLARLGQARTHA
jgi:glycosyltransferase involved in cell wall biosynthesis